MIKLETLIDGVPRDFLLDVTYNASDAWDCPEYDLYIVHNGRERKIDQDKSLLLGYTFRKDCEEAIRNHNISESEDFELERKISNYEYERMGV